MNFIVYCRWNFIIIIIIIMLCWIPGILTDWHSLYLQHLRLMHFSFVGLPFSIYFCFVFINHWTPFLRFHFKPVKCTFNCISIFLYCYTIFIMSQNLHGFMYYCSFNIHNGLSFYLLQRNLNNMQDREFPCPRPFLVSNGSVLPFKVFILCLNLTWKTFCARETCL